MQKKKFKINEEGGAASLERKNTSVSKINNSPVQMTAMCTYSLGDCYVHECETSEQNQLQFR